jgi:hypothetical protein
MISVAYILIRKCFHCMVTVSYAFHFEIFIFSYGKYGPRYALPERILYQNKLSSTTLKEDISVKFFFCSHK